MAKAGLCAPTEHNSGDCELSSSGSWSGMDSLRACNEKCRYCDNCVYVSYSKRNDDCSWYASCNLNNLTTMPEIPSARGWSYATIRANKSAAVEPTMPSNCSLTVPASLALERNRPRPAGLEPFNLSRVAQSSWLGKGKDYVFSSKAMRTLRIFAPTAQRSDGWEGAILASQHPPVCKRFLLLEDDMLNSGFGLDAKLMSVALLMAVGQRRVLLHVPGRDHIYKHFWLLIT